MQEPSRGGRVAAIRHLAFEDLGTFTEPLTARGFTVEMHDAGVDPLREPLAEADLVIILGGPIGANESDHYPFLNEELEGLERRLAADRPTFGICLGAQLIARTLGGAVYAGENGKEIGWGALELTADGARSCLAPLAEQPVLHWHGDTFDLPPETERLAGTRAYPNQAFARGRNLLALQFHVEADSRRIEQWLVGHTCELTGAGIDIGALRAESRRHGEGLRRTGAEVLTRWLDQVVW